MSDDTPQADEIVEGVLAGWRRDQQLPTEVHTLAREFLDGDDDAREPLAQELAKLRTPIEACIHTNDRTSSYDLQALVSPSPDTPPGLAAHRLAQARAAYVEAAIFQLRAGETVS